MAGEGDGDFNEKLRSIEASKKIAQQYLDRTAHHYPEQLTLPMGLWRETITQLSVAESGQRRCGARAVEPVELGAGPYSASFLLRNPISCLRPSGHDGPHAARTEAHGRHKAKWRALAWD